MFAFLKNVFRSKKTKTEQDFEETAFEQWSSNFSNPHNRRFIEEEGDAYISRFNKGLELQLLRKNLYAWTVNPQFQYKNLIIQAVFDFSKTNLSKRVSKSMAENAQAGSAAFGLLFRYVDEGNHLSFLISNQGYFRLDAYFNGNQMPLIGWTKCPSAKDQGKTKKQNEAEKKLSMEKFPIAILAHDTKIAIIINGKLALMLDDDTVQSEGYIAFAGQNWDFEEVSQASLSSIAIESRQIEVNAFANDLIENAYISSEDRIQLALSYAAVSRMVPALIEIKKALNQGISELEDYIFASRLLMSQKLFEEAEKLLDKANEAFPKSLFIIEEKASLLYLRGYYNELSAFFITNEAESKLSSRLSSLQAHLFAMKRSHKDALSHYLQASRLSPKESEHLENASLMLDELGDNEKAQGIRLSLLKDFLEKKDFPSFYRLLDIIKQKKLSSKDKLFLNSLEGLALYYINTNEFGETINKNSEQVQEALKLLLAYYTKAKKEKSAENKNALIALSRLLKEKGEIKQAIEVLEYCIETEHFEKQKEKEAKCSLEAFRELSELYASQGEIEKSFEKIHAALEIQADDGWALFIKSHLHFAQAEYDEAYKAIFSSLAILEEELAVLDLYCKIMEKKDKLPQALGSLEAIAKQSGSGIQFRSDVYHLLANYYLTLGNTKKAEHAYKKALTLNPHDESLLCDYAALCIDFDRINEADSLMSNILTNTNKPRVHQILASISVKKGDFGRSELILRQGLDGLDQNPNLESAEFWKLSLMIDLCHLYLLTNKTENAQKLFQEISLIENSERTKALENEINEKTMRKISCALCDSFWFVPKIIPEYKRRALTCQPPGTMPAGNCPDCGKTYCISCVEHTISDDGRFHCPSCAVPLKIQDPGVFWILNEWIKSQ